MRWRLNSKNGTVTDIQDERPPHEVTFQNPIWMGKTEVTQGQWFDVMQSNRRPAKLVRPGYRAATAPDRAFTVLGFRLDPEIRNMKSATIRFSLFRLVWSICHHWRGLLLLFRDGQLESAYVISLTGRPSCPIVVLVYDGWARAPVDGWALRGQHEMLGRFPARRDELRIGHAAVRVLVEGGSPTRETVTRTRRENLIA